MPVEIKFCGLTRPEDASEAARLGAAYGGVIFAGGPRRLGVERARDVLSALAPPARRVGVFAGQSGAEVGDIARELRLDVVQLHGEAGCIDAVRARFGGELWAVVPVENGMLPVSIESLLAEADAILLDPLVGGRLGGTGVPLPWEAIAAPLTAIRRRTAGRVVLAGGLRPENVAAAIAILEPDVVDVSSGVECAPGVKDHARMRAFRDAVATTCTDNG